MKSDSELLRHYVENRSESAFTELVQRHIGLVYSVALRRVGGDAHLAEDVAQKVFADLARKARSLSGRPTLSSWLYAAAHFASAAVVRGERRRKLHETEAHTMQTTSASEPDADGARLRPLIDNAFVVLKDDEREAVALRFFEKRTFADIGAALRVTEDAARKRVDRALEKLRIALTRRGVTSTTTALGVALTAIGAATAPAALGGKVASHALASASGGVPLLGTIAGTLWPAAAALFVGGALITSQSKTTDTLRTELARATADNLALARLRVENRRLAHDITALSTAPARSPALPPVAAPPADEPVPRRIAARVAVSPQGTLAWNGEPVSLADFIARARLLQASGNSEGRVHVRGVGTEFSPLAWVIDELRKAGLNHVTVESTAKPDPKQHPQWFWF